MNCVELQDSLAEADDCSTRPQRAHLENCAACFELVSELNLIVSAASQLHEADEPSPRVWNSIEAALRREGLIHPPRPYRSLIPSFTSRWAWSRWMVPAAAALLILVGVYVNQHSLARQLVTHAPPSAASVTAIAGLNDSGLNDDDLLQEVSGQTPGMRAQYEDDLRRANEYIQDAKSNLEANPNDEDARRSLMEAYQQKSMLFEMAMDRSLP